MDGNRRYGKAKYGAAGYLRGHYDGGVKLEHCIEWAASLRSSQSPPALQSLTVYAFSSENFSRPQRELDGLWDVFRTQAPSLADRCRRLNVRARILNTCGFSKFPDSVVAALKKIEAGTAACSGLSVNVCVGYSGSEDVCRAFESLSLLGSIPPSSLLPSSLLSHLQLPHQLDLLVRTSGETRLSNFALYNLAYAELLFVEKAWPEVTKEDFMDWCEGYEAKERRYGK